MRKSPRAALAGVALLSAAPVVAFSSDARAGKTAVAGTETPAPAGDRASTAADYASEVPPQDVIDNHDGAALASDHNQDSIPVAQEVDFVVGNTFRTDGGYDETLKKIAEVDYYGTRYVDCEHYPLQIHTARPDQIATLVKTGRATEFESRKSGNDIVMRGQSEGIPNDVERALVETFDFDTPTIDLQKKNPTLRPVGMQKLPKMLTWKFQGERAGEHYRVLYVDSHFGDVVKFSIMEAGGTPVVDVALHDYRVVEGIRVPFAIDYRSPGGTLLASDRLERVEVRR